MVIQEKNGPGREAGGRCIVKEMNTEKLIRHPVGHKGERKHVAGGWHWGGHRYRCLRAGGQERRRSVEQRSMFCSFCCLCVHSSPESEVPPPRGESAVQDPGEAVERVWNRCCPSPSTLQGVHGSSSSFPSSASQSPSLSVLMGLMQLQNS